MGTTLAQAYVQVIPTTKGIKGMLGKELGNEGDSGGKTTEMKFTGAFKKAIAAAGIAGTVHWRRGDAVREEGCRDREAERSKRV